MLSLWWKARAGSSDASCKEKGNDQFEYARYDHIPMSFSAKVKAKARNNPIPTKSKVRFRGLKITDAVK